MDAMLTFEIELRADDRPILVAIQKTLRCGYIQELKYERYGWFPHAKYVVRRREDLFSKVIPFFQRYPLIGKKAKDFEVFCQAAEIFKAGRHLSHEGIVELQRMRKFMNKRRPVEI